MYPPNGDYKFWKSGYIDPSIKYCANRPKLESDELVYGFPETYWKYSDGSYRAAGGTMRKDRKFFWPKFYED